MNVGIHFGDFTLPGEPESLGQVLTATAKAAEDGGCAVFTLMDHYFQMEAISRAPDPMLEGYTSVGFLAGRTARITLGLLVSGVTYRHPALLVKIATTLDVLSGGRAQLGLGAAWYEREHLGLGVPFPPLGERFERLEEPLQIALQMWSDDDGPEVVAHKLDVLRRHCDAVGRDEAEVEKTILVLGINPVDDVDAFLAAMEPYARMGVELVEIAPHGQDPAGMVARLGEKVVPRLAVLGVA